MDVRINNRKIGKREPIYFIADIASNHNGDLVKAKELIHACAESRVDAIKMQNFSAESIVSDFGFKNLKGVETHQSKWQTSVFDSYKAASIPFEWTLELKELSENLGMDYFTSPYALEIVRAVAPYVSAFKLGSGDITWHEEIAEMAKFNKPVIIATGASDLSEVKMAMDTANRQGAQVILMQCNTNYTATKGEDLKLTKDRLSNINLKVLETYGKLWPEVPLGLSDHTHGDLTVLGAVGLYDCSAVEKHFTLDSSLSGQDHSFSMMPNEWLSMVNNTESLKSEINLNDSFEIRFEKVKKYVDEDLLELTIGDGKKEVRENEKNTIIVQRRAIRAKSNIPKGAVINQDDLIVLRPCPPDALPPYRMEEIIGRKSLNDISEGDYVRLADLS